MRQLVVILTLILPAFRAFAQSVDVTEYHERFRVNIFQSSSPVVIDGELDEPVWKNTGSVHEFLLKYPNDAGRPAHKTEARVTYDDKFLFVAFTCYQEEKALVQSLKRDIGYLDNDGVGLILDPLNQNRNGFIFVLNAFNAQSEDQLSLSQDNQLTWSWNNKWLSATKRYPDHWTAELAIPFKTLRYPSGNTDWGINFFRVDMNQNQYSVWTRVPLNFHLYNLGFTGSLHWDKPPPDPGKNVVMIPFLTGGYDQDPENGKSAKGTFSGGMDAKLALNSALNLDLTLNPDFSQVEVDQQVTNLTRFDLFFPERRAFFLENADIFGEYGIPGLITPFYSRKIGLDADANRIPILAGARLSGNIGRSTRMGLMDIQTEASGTSPAQNYSAISVNQSIFSRSVLKAYYLDRESFYSADQKKNDPLGAWGRNAGIAMDFINRNGTWSGWIAYHHSFKPGIEKDNQFMETGFQYSTRNLSVVVDLTSVGTNYYTDMGFVQRIDNYDAVRDTSIRVGFKHIFNETSLKLFPKKGKLNRHTLSTQVYAVFNPDNTFNERVHNLKYKAEFRNNSMFNLTFLYDEVNLLFPISFTDATPIPAENYHYGQVMIDYSSDSRKPLSFKVLATRGGFYNGNIHSFGAGLTFRKRPHVNLTLQAEYNRLAFPGVYGRTELFLISPRLEINFNTQLSWTTFLQYNTQGNNFNINSRFQYRFKPMSDIYLVYTDNYFTDPLLKNKNRAIVFKMNYWFNL